LLELKNQAQKYEYPPSLVPFYALLFEFPKLGEPVLKEGGKAEAVRKGLNSLFFPTGEEKFAGGGGAEGLNGGGKG
jgi:hypothetical protein